MWSNSRPDVSLLCVSTNYTTIRSNVVPLYKPSNGSIVSYKIGLNWAVLSESKMNGPVGSKSTTESPDDLATSLLVGLILKLRNNSKLIRFRKRFDLEKSKPFINL